MQVLRVQERPSQRGPAEWFTGTVWINAIVTGAAPSRLSAALVSFEPGARTAWHTHPLGQTLHVLSGVGLVQLKGGPAREIHPGDTAVIAPGELHWHGAAPSHNMTHLALQEMNEQGVAVTWLDHVTDAEYNQIQSDASY
jgi:quercetin dioxygenase-like cupin family protein